MNDHPQTGQLAMIREILGNESLAIGAMALMFLACLLA